VPVAPHSTWWPVNVVIGMPGPLGTAPAEPATVTAALGVKWAGRNIVDGYPPKLGG